MPASPPRHAICQTPGMRPLRYSINVTLDGCCDHAAATPTRELHEYAARGIARADALLFGRVIYQMMEDAWRPAAEAGMAPAWMHDWMVPFAHTIHAARKYVVSDTLDKVDWNAELIRGVDLLKPSHGSSSSPAEVSQSVA